ncbi:MAG TPA: hypothetical protein VHK47_02435 [Polyangia bacterium]|nr:hypothetical protein [Polyangia bacterium]
MRRSASPRGAALLAVVCTFAATARADEPKKQTPQERKRQQLLDELGLERASPAAPSLPTPAPATDAAPASHDGAAPTSAAAPPAGPSFKRIIHPLLTQSCQVCHRVGGPAAATRLVLSGDAASDYAVVRALVTPSAPASSALLRKSAGQMHGGGAPWPADGDAHARVLAWIARGAHLDGANAPSVVAPTPGSGPAPRPAAARAPVATPAPAPTFPREASAATSAEAPPVAAGVSAPSPRVDDVHAILTTACAGCHAPPGPGSMTRLVLSGDEAADLSAARALIDPAAPARSLLVTKASGELHAGGVVLREDDPRRARLVAWAGSFAAPAAPATPHTDVVTSASRAAGARTTPGDTHAGPGAITLPWGFFLNGRFDLNYERHHFSGDPWADGSTAALRSYHHFLFLSRESANDPFGLSIEILSLQFWEAHARLGGHGRPWRLIVGGGKIIVPFGADPLVHQSYGGLAGFDQRILPPIWAVEGVAAHFLFERGRFAVTNDAYVVHGYALPRADAVLNLQADFSSSDDVRLGYGDRVGVAFLGASAWYSAYLNTLGFGRLLFMQAADLTIARPRSVPVLGHFSLGAGLLRADVSGGGPGLDYYQFGSYLWLRYHPTDWLFFQYRQGLRTYENRRGLILDETRLSPEDMSTHNFEAVARCRGVSFALGYFLIFEKAGEIPNDFLRLSVAYDF